MRLVLYGVEVVTFVNMWSALYCALSVVLYRAGLCVSGRNCVVSVSHDDEKELSKSHRNFFYDQPLVITHIRRQYNQIEITRI